MHSFDEAPLCFVAHQDAHVLQIDHKTDNLEGLSMELLFVLMWYPNLIKEVEEMGLIRRHEMPIWFIK